MHAALVQSTIADGMITRIDAGDAEAAPGVLAVITYENAPALAQGPTTALLGATSRFPLKDNRILYYGQHVAVVVAETLEQATAAARLVKIDYAETNNPLGSLPPWPAGKATGLSSMNQASGRRRRARPSPPSSTCRRTTYGCSLRMWEAGSVLDSRPGHTRSWLCSRLGSSTARSS